MFKKNFSSFLLAIMLTGMVPEVVQAVQTSEKELAVSQVSQEPAAVQLPSTDTPAVNLPAKPIVPDSATLEKIQQQDNTEGAPQPQGAAVTAPPPAPNGFPSTPPNQFSGLKGLKGKFDTDLFTGGGSFAYPLELSPGRSNLMPAVNLQYSTFNTRLGSPVGYGWDLTSSSIFRSSNKGTDKLYTDNVFTASIFGTNEEIVLTNSNTNEYRPKIQGSFMLYYFNNNSWTAQGKDGTRYVFGSSGINRQVHPTDTTKVYKWVLEKIQDPNGNTITFTYTKDQNQIYPDTIHYTGNGVDQGIFEVKFVLENAPFAVQNATTGFPVTTAKRVNEIQMRINSGSGYQTAYSYKLGYDDTGLMKNKLLSITLQSGTTVLPATTFSYTGQNETPVQQPNLLKSATTPYGGKTTIVYKSSQQYVVGGTLANPKLHLLINTVQSVTTKNTATDTPKTVTYVYKNGHYFFDNLDAYKREYAGFQEVDVTDALGNITKLFFHQSEKSPYNIAAQMPGLYADHISKKGKIYRQEQYDNTGKLYSTEVSVWNKQDYGNGRFWPYLQQKALLQYDGTATHRDNTVLYNYDSYGNIILEKNFGETQENNQGTGIDLGTDTVTKETAYIYNTALSLVSFPQTQTLKDNVGTILQQTRYYYDSLPLGQVSKGNLTKQEDWLNPGNRYIPSKQVTYNTYGLPLTITDALNHTTTVTYDTYNLYPASTTNAKNQTTTATYDYPSGQVKDTTDPNQAKTSTTYDPFARPTQIQVSNPATPATLVTLKTIQYFDTTTPFKVLTIDFNGQAGDTGRPTYEYYDGFGQKLQTRTVAETTNQYSVTSILYDEKNRPKKELLPIFESGPIYTLPSPTARGNAFSYDALDRVLSLSNNIGTTSTTYDKWTKTVTDANNHIKKFYQDAYQNLIKVEEKNGTSTYTTNYTYDPLQRLTKITDAENNVRNFTYDSLSRLLSQDMLHPASQTTNISQWSYTYDDANNLTTKTDPNLQTTTYTYDQLNRPLTEDSTTQTGIEVTNEYDTGTYAIGRLNKVITNGLVTSDTFDILGRVLSETKTIDGTNYTNSTTYDLQGSPLTVTYPNSKTVSYTYNNAYQLNSITLTPLTPTPLLTNLDYAPNGSITRLDYANGTTTLNTYDYDKLYRLTAKKTSKGTTILQDLAYTFDPVGNLLNITENAPTAVKRSSTYTYDDLDRILSASITNLNDSTTTNQTFSYSATGNITSNSLLGNYLYEGTNDTNPQAVTKVGTGPTSRTYQYDRNGNVTLTTNAGGTTQNLAYDYRNNLTQTTKGTAMTKYTYDSSYNRVKKWTQGGTSQQMTVSSEQGTDSSLQVPDSSEKQTEGSEALTEDIKTLSLDVPSTEQTSPLPAEQTGSGSVVTNAVTAAPTLSSLSPITGAVGTSMIAMGTGFTATANTVTFACPNNTVATANLTSYQSGTRISLLVPNTLTGTGNCSVWVTNANGTSNTKIFTLIPPPTLTNLSPNGGLRGSTVVATGTGFSYTNNVRFICNSSQADIYSVPSSNGTSLTFTVPSGLSAPSSCNVKVYISSGAVTNSLPFTVIIPALGTLSPTSGPVGTGITATGTGFSATGNTANFSCDGGYYRATVSNLSSSDATTLNFAVPASLAGATNCTVTAWVPNFGYTNSLPFTLTAGSGNSNGNANININGNANVNGNLNGNGNVNINTNLNTNGNINANGNLNTNGNTNTNGNGNTNGTPSNLTLYLGGYEVEGIANSTGVLQTTNLQRINVSVAKGQSISLETNPATSTTSIIYHHTDHLTGSSVDTDANGYILEVQDYLPFGSTRVDQKFQSYANKKKFTGKELDSESGLYYYGARYYDSEIGRWMGVDPLVLGGVKEKGIKDILPNPQELNGYTYSLNRPLVALDPGGLLTIFIHGTYSNSSMWSKEYMQTVANDFSDQNFATFSWVGANAIDARTTAANDLVNRINAYQFAEGETLNIVGHSHGGNVAIEALNNAGLKRNVDTLVLLGTPNRDDYQITEKSKVNNVFNIYHLEDDGQKNGGKLTNHAGIADNPWRPGKNVHNFQFIKSAHDLGFDGWDAGIKIHGWLYSGEAWKYIGKTIKDFLKSKK